MSCTIKCIECGKQFEAQRTSAKYCSKRCKQNVKNRQNVETQKRNANIPKVCEHCCEPFMAYYAKLRFCSRQCAARARVFQYGNPVEPIKRQGEAVNIKITEHIPVFAHMRPKFGGVYEAIKVKDMNRSNNHNYLIQSIGRHGLLVKSNECEEVEEDVIE